MPTLYDNFSQVKQYIDQEKPDLTSYVTKTELANASYASTTDLNNYLNTSNLSKTSATSYHTLWTRGLSVTSNNAIYPTYLSTSNVEDSWYSEGWIACSTLKNYVADKLNSASYVTKDELSAQSYLTAVPNTYPTYAAIESMGYMTQAASYAYLSIENLRTNNNRPVQLRAVGLQFISSNYTIAPREISYEYINTSTYNNAWIGNITLKNYVNGRLAEIESSYATTSYVVDYVAEHGGGGSTVIDENIIPKETNTYTLGDSSYMYNATYSTYLMNTSNAGFYASSNYTIHMILNAGNRYFWDNEKFSSASNNTRNLGSASLKWATTYTTNLYADNIHNLIWTGTAAEYAALSDYTTYQFYLVQES